MYIFLKGFILLTVTFLFMSVRNKAKIKDKNTTMRPSWRAPCIPRDTPVTPSGSPHANSRPIGALGRSHTHEAHTHPVPSHHMVPQSAIRRLHHHLLRRPERQHQTLLVHFLPIHRCPRIPMHSPHACCPQLWVYGLVRDRAVTCCIKYNKCVFNTTHFFGRRVYCQ